MLIKKKIKIIFFTNNIRALNIIEKILKKNFLKIELVVTTKKNTPKLLFKKIKLYKIKKLFFENNENSIYKHVKNIDPDFIICSGFTKLIPLKILNLANYCSINLHGGRVPSYLGASTLNWQIINGEKQIYISALKMNEKYDDGPLISQKKININNNDNIDKIKVKVNKYFPELFFKALKHILLKKKLIYFKKYKKKYWKQRNKKNSEIIVKKYKSKEVHNMIRACSVQDYPAFINYQNSKIYLYKSTLTKKSFKKIDEKDCIIFKKKKLLIKCSDKYLTINRFKIS